MNLQRGFSTSLLTVALVLVLAGVAQLPQTAWASMEDAAVFYDELKQEGEWVDYGDYGPVWYPTQVQENWRPYVDGRWTPSEEGYVFETQEPWGPSTYHYGNWMPTQEYGWVWVPGRTWYPNTVSWRTSSESEAPEASYIGWAPVPPPNYTPTQGYYPQDYRGGGSYGGGVDSLISSPFWIFVKATSFLLGFNAPYTPSYSYWGCGALLPPQVVPYYYSRTAIVNNYYSPGYYPSEYIPSGGGYYNWGPPVPYVARVTRLNPGVINNYMRQVNIYQRRNVVPPPGVLARRAYMRDILPPAMLSRQPLPLGPRFHGARVARANLVQPNLVHARVIKSAPGIPGTIPKARMAGGEPGSWGRRVPGAALPASAMLRPNRQMTEHMKNIPATQRLEPVSPVARKWRVPQTPAAPVVQSGPAPRRQNPTVATAKPSSYGPPAPGGVVNQRSYQGPSQSVAPGQPPASPGWQRRLPPTETVTPRSPGPTQAMGPQPRSKPDDRQSGPWGKHQQTPQAMTSPAPSPQPRPLQTHKPGPPPSASATSFPGQPQPQAPRQPQAQQLPQAQPQRQRQPQPQPQVQQRPQPQPQMQMQRQPQVQRQPQPQMQRQPQQAQIQRQSQPQPQRQAQPQPQAQCRPQPQSKPQGQQQQNKKHNQQNQ
jgi:hypothetical protein